MRNSIPPADPRRRFDRLFLAACTGAYLVLIAAVIAALRMYGG